MRWWAIGLQLFTLQLFLASPFLPAFFGSLQDLVDCELEYEASDDYLEDQAYWTRNFPRKAGRITGCRKARANVIRIGLLRRFNWTLRSFAESKSCAEAWNVPRSSVITAACALLVRGWCAEGSEVVLDFPVSRRVRPESKTLPGMVAGVVPLVLTVSPESTVADFCEHVDTRMREALQHQRFPVHALERKVRSRGPGQPANRVSVNFIPSTFTLDFGWCPGIGDIDQLRPGGRLRVGLLWRR